MKKILFFGIDQELMEEVRKFFAKGGCHVILADSFEEGKKLFNKYEISLVIVDTDLPDETAFLFCKWIQRWEKSPILFVSTEKVADEIFEEHQVSEGNYMIKPFDMEMLFRKAKMIISREKKDTKVIYEDGYLNVNLETGRMYIEENPCVLTPTEFHIVKLFLEHQNKVLTYNFFLEYLWDHGAQFSDKHALAVNINRLRKKIETPEHQYITNVYGKGYTWN